jgi:hypothetical protein
VLVSPILVAGVANLDLSVAKVALPDIGKHLTRRGAGGGRAPLADDDRFPLPRAPDLKR